LLLLELKNNHFVVLELGTPRFRNVLLERVFGGPARYTIIFRSGSLNPNLFACLLAMDSNFELAGKAASKINYSAGTFADKCCAIAAGS